MFKITWNMLRNTDTFVPLTFIFTVHIFSTRSSSVSTTCCALVLITIFHTFPVLKRYKKFVSIRNDINLHRVSLKALAFISIAFIMTGWIVRTSFCVLTLVFITNGFAFTIFHWVPRITHTLMTNTLIDTSRMSWAGLILKMMYNFVGLINFFVFRKLTELHWFSSQHSSPFKEKPSSQMHSNPSHKFLHWKKK